MHPAHEVAIDDRGVAIVAGASFASLVSPVWRCRLAETAIIATGDRALHEKRTRRLESTPRSGDEIMQDQTAPSGAGVGKRGGWVGLVLEKGVRRAPLPQARRSSTSDSAWPPEIGRRYESPFPPHKIDYHRLWRTTTLFCAVHDVGS